MAARRRLSHLLLASHVGLALLLTVVLLASGASTIHAAVREQARAQATQAAAEGMRRLDGLRRDLAVAAGLLSERPTLHRYLQRRQSREASQFLESFRRTARLDYIRVVRSGEVFVETGTAPPEPSSVGLSFDPQQDAPWLIAQETIEVLPAAVVIVAHRIRERELVSQDSGEIDLELVSAGAISGGGDAVDPRRSALRHALATGEAETVVRRGGFAALRGEPIRSAAAEDHRFAALLAAAMGNEFAFVAPTDDFAALRVEPVRSAEDHRIVALLAASVPQFLVTRQTFGWLAAFGSGGLAIVSLAAALAAWLAQRIARPFAGLARAAERLGVGDLETPIPAPATDLAEPNALAHSLDSMRRQVQSLTATERRQRRELDAVLDGVDEGIIAIDAERRIRYANRQFLELVGRSDNEVIGSFCGDVLRPELRDGIRPCERDCPLLAARAAGLAQAVERCGIGGRTRALVIRSTAPAGGRQVAIMREETQAEAARAMRDWILANLSHELQTPLAAQVASIELLRDHMRRSADTVAKQLVGAQYRGALRLSQLVENLLDSMRIESGEMRLRREPVDLVTVVEDAVELMRPLIEQRDQHVVLALRRSERTLLGDAQRLSQVTVNLLANANKFAPDQSTIWVELVWGEEYVSFWIEDEGPGLPPVQSRADLFAPFRRAPHEEPAQRGTGLGLTIVRALVERHGGEVVVTEPVHRRGARFGVVLPLEAACAS